MASKEDVLAAFVNSDKPLKSAEVAAQLGVEKPEVDKAIKALKAEGKLVSPKVCFYTAA
ncbi:MAG: hypothetical protein LBV00_01365 [Propionibacteriaceae bacterium]|jgi:Mn-dependent DtxR family transcriptional regulator|nr:hypothetical protein [Propionibacteriaceae bacterium]